MSGVRAGKSPQRGQSISAASSSPVSGGGTPQCADVQLPPAAHDPAGQARATSAADQRRLIVRRASPVAASLKYWAAGSSQASRPGQSRQSGRARARYEPSGSNALQTQDAVACGRRAALPDQPHRVGAKAVNSPCRRPMDETGCAKRADQRSRPGAAPALKSPLSIVHGRTHVAGRQVRQRFLFHHHHGPARQRIARPICPSQCHHPAAAAKARLQLAASTI